MYQTKWAEREREREEEERFHALRKCEIMSNEWVEERRISLERNITFVHLLGKLNPEGRWSSM